MELKKEAEILQSLAKSDKCKAEGSTEGQQRTESDLFTSQNQPCVSRQNGPNIVEPSPSTSATCYSNGSNSSYDVEMRKQVPSDKAKSNQIEGTANKSDLETTKPNHSVPSTSGVSQEVENVPNCKRPLSLKLKKLNNDEEDSSSDTGNEDYSLGSEDGCIYTYRGGEHLADLPSSFVSLDMGLPQDNHLPMLPNYPLRADNAANRGSRASSPDMDFLEMDFDPGPSCEADGDESSPDANLEAENHLPVEEEPVLVREPTPEVVIPEKCTPKPNPQCDSMPSTSRGYTGDNQPQLGCYLYSKLFIIHTNTKGEKLLVKRSRTLCETKPLVSFQYSIGVVSSSKEIEDDDLRHALPQLNEELNHCDRPSTSSATYRPNRTNKHIEDRQKPPNEDPLLALESKHIMDPEDGACIVTLAPELMTWSQEEAAMRLRGLANLAPEISTIINVFDALSIPVDRDRITAALRPRIEVPTNAPLPRYLLTRSVESYTAADLISCMHTASQGQISARFFSTYPERAISLSHWITNWINLGAVLILTRNSQNCYADLYKPPCDGWNHQMVHGVSELGIYMTNPLICVMEEHLWAELSSPGVILVHVNDIWSRFNQNTDLTPLSVVPDQRYHTFNVLGQVVHVIREHLTSRFRAERQRGEYVTIPSSCEAGITVVTVTGSPAHRQLEQACPMPLLAHSTNVEIPKEREVEPQRIREDEQDGHFLDHHFNMFNY